MAVFSPVNYLPQCHPLPLFISLSFPLPSSVSPPPSLPPSLPLSLSPVSRAQACLNQNSPAALGVTSSALSRRGTEPLVSSRNATLCFWLRLYLCVSVCVCVCVCFCCKVSNQEEALLCCVIRRGERASDVKRGV